jgi:hypothetical protein
MLTQFDYNTQVRLIRNELSIELACEGQRFQDIRRWNIAATVMKTTTLPMNWLKHVNGIPKNM